jgi:hypothetical protein
MFKFLLLAIAFGLGFWIFQQSLPDIQRYLRMRTM